MSKPTIGQARFLAYKWVVVSAFPGQGPRAEHFHSREDADLALREGNTWGGKASLWSLRVEKAPARARGAVGEGA